MKSSFCIDLQRFMLIPTKFPLSLYITLESGLVARDGYKKKCPTTSRGRAPNFINQYLYLYKNLNSYFDSSSTASSAFLAVRFAAGFLAAGAFVFSSFARSFSSVASIFSILVCRRTISFDFISISSS